MSELRDNIEMILVIVLMAFFANFAGGCANERAWKANPESARIDCEDGIMEACTYGIANGLFTNQYAQSGSGNQVFIGPK